MNIENLPQGELLFRGWEEDGSPRPQEPDPGNAGGGIGEGGNKKPPLGGGFYFY